MALPIRRLYWVTAVIFFMIIVMSVHKNNTVSNKADNYQQQPPKDTKLESSPPKSPGGNKPKGPGDNTAPPGLPSDNTNNNNRYGNNGVSTSGFVPGAGAELDTSPPNLSRNYDSLILIPSYWTQLQNRQWIRETLFGIQNNLTPCKSLDGKHIYKFYIYGQTTWAKTTRPPHSAEYNQALVRDLYAEYMEYDDFVVTNTTVNSAKEKHAVWEGALEWGVNKFIPAMEITVDKVIILDSTTVMNIPKVEAVFTESLVANKGQLYTWIDDSITTHSAALTVPVAKTILDNRNAIKAAEPNSLSLVHAASLYYTANPNPAFTVSTASSQLWASDIDQVLLDSIVVGQVYQREDWWPIISKLRIASIRACAPDVNRKEGKVIMTSSYIYPDMCMAEASLPAAENKREYAAKFGYDFVARGAEFAQEEFRGRRPVWGKIGAIQKVLPHYKWLFWMDMDAIIADLDFSLDDLIAKAESMDTMEGRKEISLIVARPVKDRILNAGVMMIKNTDWTRRFLNEVQTHKANYHVSSYEQKAIWDVMTDEKWKDNVFMFDGDDHTMNTFPKLYAEGDFVVHFAPAGCPAESVLEGLKRINKKESLLGME